MVFCGAAAAHGFNHQVLLVDLLEGTLRVLGLVKVGLCGTVDKAFKVNVGKDALVVKKREITFKSISR